MKRADIVAKIREALPDASVELEDLTGTEDHWKAIVTSAGFAGKTRIQRHRMIFDALREEMQGPIHALTLVTNLPATGTDNST